MWVQKHNLTSYMYMQVFLSSLSKNLSTFRGIKKLVRFISPCFSTFIPSLFISYKTTYNVSFYFLKKIPHSFLFPHFSSLSNMALVNETITLYNQIKRDTISKMKTRGAYKIKIKKGTGAYPFHCFSINKKNHSLNFLK